MKTKLQRKQDGPGWIEVFFGAILSLLLGVVLAALYLVFKPTTTVKDLPKETIPHMVYYIEGTRDSSKIRELGAKRRQFAEKKEVAFNEDELNTLAMPAAPEHTTKKMELPQPAAAKQTITPGTPNFRIRKDVMQIGVPVTLNVYETDIKVVLQTRGTFVKQGDAVVFQPGELFIGSCPLEQLPAVKDYIMKQVVAKLTVPDELGTMWRNVADAKIDGSTVRITSR